jgi:hypothetical protein
MSRSSRICSATAVGTLQTKAFLAGRRGQKAEADATQHGVSKDVVVGWKLTWLNCWRFLQKMAD